MDKRKHPSGKPVPETGYRELGFKRIPHEGALTPSLQRRNEKTVAIGFTAERPIEDD